MSPPDDYLSSNVETTSNILLGVPRQNERGLIVMYLLLISFVLGWFLYLLTIPLIDSGSIDNSNESGHLNNPRDGMD